MKRTIHTTVSVGFAYAVLTLSPAVDAAAGQTVAASSALSTISTSLSLQDAPVTSDQWRVDLNSWFWLMGVHGDIGARGRTAEVDADFGDILDASDSVLAFSGRLEIGYGKIAGFIDGFYADIGADDQTGPAGLADIDVTFQQGIIDFGLMYRLGDWEPSGDAAKNRKNLTLDLYAGARYNSIELELEPENLASRSRSESWIDPIVGAKLVLPISEHWQFQINGDVGGFGVSSDFTWSTTAAFGFNFEFFDLPATVLLGYRGMGWDYSDGSGNDEFAFDVTQHGPLLGLSLHF